MLVWEKKTLAVSNFRGCVFQKTPPTQWRSLFDPKDWKKVAVNLDDLKFCFITSFTSAYVLPPSNRGKAKQKQKKIKISKLSLC